MRAFKPFILTGLGLVTAAESDSVCSSPGVVTMYITVPSGPVTETIYAASPGSPSVEGAADTAIVPTLTITNSITETIYVGSPGVPSVEGGADTAIVPTLAVTNSVASTHVVQVIKATTLPGPYSFTDDNGTTSWMGGKTPPASASLVTSTLFITLQPVSTPVSESASADMTTSYVTIFSTETVTNTYTKTLIESLSIMPASTKTYTGHGYTGLGSAGWNSTLTTFLKLKVIPTGSGRATLSVYEPGAPINSWSRQGDVDASPTSSTNSTRPIKPRQVGDIIVATVDGVAVSWTNNYDGSAPTFSEAGPTFVPVTATAPPFALTLSPSTTRQPGIVPMPSISTSGMASVLSAIFTAQHVSSTNPTRVSSTKYSSASATSDFSASTPDSSCGNAPAQFTVDFDDLPSFSTGPSDTDIPPIFNPYRKLYWEGHYGYVPPPTDPFPPHSPPQLAVYREDGLNLKSSTDAGLDLTGGLGSGPRADYDAYWFDALSAWLGCADGGADDCIITITGYANGEDNITAVKGQTVRQPSCPGLKSCSLALVNLDDGFRNLMTLQIVATINEKAVDWYMDDLELSWSNNTCAAQLMRSSSK